MTLKQRESQKSSASQICSGSNCQPGGIVEFGAAPLVAGMPGDGYMFMIPAIVVGIVASVPMVPVSSPAITTGCGCCCC